MLSSIFRQLAATGQFASSNMGYPQGGRIGPEKRPWDMPTSQSNSVLETWIHADFRRTYRRWIAVNWEPSDAELS